MDIKIVDAVQKKLEQQGIIQNLRLQLRSHVLNVLKSSQDNNLVALVPKLSADNSNKEILLKHVRELLVSLDLKDTTKAFDNESGFISSPSTAFSPEPKRPALGVSTSPSYHASSPSYSESKHTNSFSPTKTPADDDSKLFEVSKDFSVASSSFDLDNTSQSMSPPRQQPAPATSFKPLGSQVMAASNEDSNDNIEVPEDDYEDESFSHHEDSGIAISSSFEPDSPAKITLYAPNTTSSSSTRANSTAYHATVEVKSASNDVAASTSQDSDDDHKPGRATVRSISGGNIILRSERKENKTSSRATHDDEYDFDDKGPEVSLHAHHHVADAKDSDSDSNHSPVHRSSAAANYHTASSAWMTSSSSNDKTSNQKSNNQEDEDDNDDHSKSDDDDGDFNDEDIDNALPSESHQPVISSQAKKPTQLFHKSGSRLEEDDDDDDRYKAPVKASSYVPSKATTIAPADDDYGDDFDEVEEIEEDDDMSVGKDDDDESQEDDDNDDKKYGSSSNQRSYQPPRKEEQRLSAVEARMKELESDDKTGSIARFKAQKTASYQLPGDDSSDDISVASENVDEMDFSVGDHDAAGSEDHISMASSTDSNLYSFLDTKPSSSQASKPSSSSKASTSTGKAISSPDAKKCSLSTSGDFSMSDHEIDALGSDASYDYTTNAQPPDRKR